MDGIIVVDKPPDMMSAKLVSRVKFFLKAAKVGHAGTLDPFATGVMICLINRATRLADFLLHGRKAYTATLRLGIETDTQDPTGTVISAREVGGGDYSTADIQTVFGSFLGQSWQTPSSFSALKHHGKPLYQYAREGIRVEKPARPIHVFSLRVDEIDLPFVRFSVCCSGGTYVRALARDIGRALGCGAHLHDLRRTEACGFTAAEALPWTEVEERAGAGRLADRIIGMNEALRQIPGIVADESLAAMVRHGRRLEAGVIPEEAPLDAGGCLKLIDKSERLLAVVQRREDGFRYRCVFSE